MGEREIILFYTTSDNTKGQDKAKLLVYVSGSASPSTICAGGNINPNLDIHKAEIIATTIPTISGIPISFKITGDKGYDGIEEKEYYDVGESRGNLSSTSGTTGSDGKIGVIYISGSDSSNPETFLYYSVAIGAFYQDTQLDTQYIQINPPQMDLDIFLDPETEQPLEYLIADGESQAKNKVYLTFNNNPVSGREIEWLFRFWTIEQLNEVSQEMCNKDFYDLDSQQQEYILSNISNFKAPKYVGSGPCEYGRITSFGKTTPYGLTDENGQDTSIYRVGTIAGYVEIGVAENNIRLPHHSEWGWLDKLLEWLYGRKGEEIKIEIKKVIGINKNEDNFTNKFIPFSSDPNKNKATIKYDITPADLKLDRIKIVVYKENGTKIYEKTYTEENYTKGENLTITWDGKDNQTEKNFAFPEDNSHKIKLIGEKNNKQYESNIKEINVDPLIVKVFSIHAPFSCSASVPQFLTIKTIIKAQIDQNTTSETDKYRYYTESGGIVNIWDGRTYCDSNILTYPNGPNSYWIEKMDKVNINTYKWDEKKLGDLKYVWETIRGDNIEDIDNDGVVTKTFSNPGTHVYRVKVINISETNNGETIILQEEESPEEKDISYPEQVIYVENIQDAYMIHLKEDSENDAYSWASSFLNVPYKQRAIKDYHKIDCSGLVHASNQLRGWNIPIENAHTYLTSKVYSSRLHEGINPDTDVKAQRNGWIGIDKKTENGGFDGIWNHIGIIKEYRFIPECNPPQKGHKFTLIHARGGKTGKVVIQEQTPEDPVYLPDKWNLIFCSPIK